MYVDTGALRCSMAPNRLVTIGDIHPPQYLCHLLSGFLSDIIQFGIGFALYKKLQGASLLALSFAMPFQ
jgi:hypothetical protein